MKVFLALIVLFTSLSISGCIGDRTKNMAEACQNLLVQNDRSEVRAFIKDGEGQLSALNRPNNEITAYLRNLQDPDAMTHKPALEECLWLLKSRQT